MIFQLYHRMMMAVHVSTNVNILQNLLHPWQHLNLNVQEAGEHSFWAVT
jgi:hypothetical protein